jgi:hypothetical protein
VTVDEFLTSGQEWAQYYGIVIYDSDGWARNSPLGYCSLADLINEREFWMRVVLSTCTKFPDKARERLNWFKEQGGLGYGRQGSEEQSESSEEAHS